MLRVGRVPFGAGFGDAPLGRFARQRNAAQKWSNGYVSLSSPFTVVLLSENKVEARA